MRSETDCVKPTTLIKTRQQCCCIYQACALPCDSHFAPSMLAVCGLVLYPKVGCAQKLSEIPHKTLMGAPPAAESAAGGPAAPDADAMSRS